MRPGQRLAKANDLAFEHRTLAGPAWRVTDHPSSAFTAFRHLLPQGEKGVALDCPCTATRPLTPNRLFAFTRLSGIRVHRSPIDPCAWSEAAG